MSVAISWAKKVQLARCDDSVGFPKSSHIYAYITPTTDTDYSCHIKDGTYLTNCMGSISHHITPLVNNSLGADTQTHTHTYIRGQKQF